MVAFMTPPMGDRISFSGCVVLMYNGFGVGALPGEDVGLLFLDVIVELLPVELLRALKLLLVPLLVNSLDSCSCCLRESFRFLISDFVAIFKPMLAMLLVLLLPTIVVAVAVANKTKPSRIASIA